MRILGIVLLCVSQMTVAFVQPLTGSSVSPIATGSQKREYRVSVGMVPKLSLEASMEDAPSTHNSAAKQLALGLLLASCVSVSGTASPAMAADTATSSTATEMSVLSHDYSDPLHPQCRRTIQVDSDGKTFHYTGTGVGPSDDPVLRGCTPGEIKQYGLRTGSFDGRVLSGLRLSAGDGIHEGVWEPANSVTTVDLKNSAVDGIRWNDGNKWIVSENKEQSLGQVIGEWIFLAYIGFSTLAGAKGVYDKIQEKRDRAANS